MFSINDGYVKSYESNHEPPNHTILGIPAGSVRTEIHLKNGEVRMHEIYYGSGYLSQSTRSIQLSGKEQKIVVYDKNNHEKILYEVNQNLGLLPSRVN